MPELPRVVPAMVTPLSEGGERVLLDIIPQHLAYLEHRGADGVLALGTNGEGPSLSLDERRDVINAVLTHRGRLHVFAGTGCAALPDAIVLSRHAIEQGADAVMIVPPFYFKGVSDDGLFAYYEALLSALPSERKVLLYNIPDMSGVEITDDLIDALLERYADRLLGVKDTSGNVGRTRRYVQRYPQLAVYNGSDPNLARAIDSGIAGAISAVANVFPDLVGWVFRAHESHGDVAGAQADLSRVLEVIARYPSPSAVKHALRFVAGLPPTHVRPPLRDLTPDEARSLERELAALEAG